MDELEIRDRLDSESVNEGEESERPNQAALEALGREIDQETEAIADLRRRTHTLEIEIASWRREPWRPPTGGGPAEPMDRVLEMALG